MENSWKKILERRSNSASSPEKGDWAAMQKLMANKGYAPKKTNSLKYIIPAIALLLAIGSTAYFFNDASNKNPKEIEQTSNSTNTANPSNKTHKKEIEQNQIASEPIHAKSAVSKKNKDIEKIAETEPVKYTSKPDLVTPNKISNSNLALNEEEVLNKENAQNNEATYIDKNKNQTLRDASKTIPLLNDQTWFKKPLISEKRLLESLVSIPNSSSILEHQLDLRQVNSIKPKAKEPLLQLYAVQIGASYRSNFQSLSTSYQQAGADIYLHHKNWMINVGINRGRVEQFYDETLTSNYWNIDSTDSWETFDVTDFTVTATWIIDSFYAGHYEYDTVFNTYQDSTYSLLLDSLLIENTSSKRSKRTSSYISVPLTVGYRLSFNRWEIIPNAGVNLSRFTQYDFESTETTSYLGMELLFSPDFRYYITDRLALYGRLNLTYPIKEIKPITQVGLSYGGQLGLSIRL